MSYEVELFGGLDTGLWEERLGTPALSSLNKDKKWQVATRRSLNGHPKMQVVRATARRNIGVNG